MRDDNMVKISYYAENCKADLQIEWKNNQINIVAPPELSFEIKTISSINHVIMLNDEAGEFVFRRTLKVLSVNCHLLPPKIVALKDPEKRGSIIGDIIIEEEKEETGGYDVVLLQEAFHQQSKDNISDKIKKYFPYIKSKFGADRFFVGVNSGLFVASKFPIVDRYFGKYPNVIGSDYLASKGIAGVSIDCTICFSENPLKQKHVVVIGNTHLQSNPDPSVPWKVVSGPLLEKKKKAISIRREQCEMIHNDLETMAHKINSRPDTVVSVLMCGDFNVVAELPQYLVDLEEKGPFIEKEHIDEKNTNNKLNYTQEYKNMIKGLGNPVDILRKLYDDIDKYPETTGSTDKNTRDIPRRVDFVFSYEEGIGSINSQSIAKLKPLSMKQFVLRPKDDEHYDVTDHKGLVCIFELENPLKDHFKFQVKKKPENNANSDDVIENKDNVNSTDLNESKIVFIQQFQKDSSSKSNKKSSFFGKKSSDKEKIDDKKDLDQDDIDEEEFEIVERDNY
eukprot:TRINITY_DN3567_c0_g1_i1.p1 TRINITY_DN3567_c0_g1~~TRINITY_DN3567_c0_g1_i1.p1  ORF type:complete len:557 (-),score=151.08 TRINITY_DN3567_c0_g1_i1:48-1568(-)